MPNRLFYVVKLTSSLLKEYKYNLQLSFEDCLRGGLVISLSDSQMLKTCRACTGQQIDRVQLEEWYTERDRLKKRKNSKDNRDRVKELQDKIYDMMYIPEYVTVVMENLKDYERMYKKGFVFNGRTYRRFSCSASQARVSTIVFVDVTIKDEMLRRLNCGRDLNHPLAASKLNAYFGLYSSSIKQVRTPRFCIVPDCEVEYDVNTSFVVETDKNSDDIIEDRVISNKFNLFDGSGLISPQMAELWGQDLGEPYTPCNFCLRWVFTKGMVNEFDFLKFCEEKNNGNYIIKDIWGNDVDLRNIDVILSEGQVKLWDSWKSQEDMERLAKENGIVFGITKYSPQKDKDVLITNYQYLQTLNLDDQMIKDLCQDTVDYIQGVSYDNIYYSLLFMLGDGMDTEKLYQYMNSSDNYWLKSLILNHNLLNDKYSKEKIRDMIIRKIELACLGKLVVRGNYQCICPDPYAYMEWICYRDKSKVIGLLNPHEAYCDYWNKVGNTEYVDSMRSPLTHYSEHGIDKLMNTEEMQKWYGYCYSGYISNVHDEFTMVHAGSDFDYDIISSTNSKQFVNGKYPNQKVVVYNAKKPKKKVLCEDDLYKSDTFSFGQQIGPITNIASTFCAMATMFPEGSEERKLIEDRVKMCCASQSRQIDKTKIGEAVKAIPSVWTQFQRKKPEDTEEEIKKKDFYNSILADKKPYFFRYKYNHLAKEYNDYVKKTDENCQLRYSMTLDELIKMNEDTPELMSQQQIDFLMYYDKFLPVIDSDCVMNKICKYIENMDFHIKQKVRSSCDFDYKLLTNGSFNPNTMNSKTYRKIQEEIESTFKDWQAKSQQNKKSGVKYGLNDSNKIKFDKDMEIAALRNRLEQIDCNEEQLSNYLVYLFYVDKPSYSKGTLWNLVGKQIYENIRNRTSCFYFPIKDANGTLKYLYENYSIQQIQVKDLDAELEESESEQEVNEVCE